jgi:hypothetical protein
MSESDVGVVLAHGGWADGSSWSKVIAGLRSERVKAVAAPLPLTSLADDVALVPERPRWLAKRGECLRDDAQKATPCRGRRRRLWTWRRFRSTAPATS